MPQVQVTRAAPLGQRFAADAFTGQVGRTVPAFIGDPARPAGLVTLLAAVVAADGTDVVLTLDLPGGLVATPPLLLPRGHRGHSDLVAVSSPRP
jgi:hypothetical protein